MRAGRTLTGTRQQVFALLLGVVVGSLVAGLAVPLVFGESVTDVDSNGSSAAPAAGVGRSATGAATDDSTATSDTESTAPAAGDAFENGAADVATGSTGTAADTTASDATTGSGAAMPGEANEATDVGVTATELHVGILIFDLAGVSRSGFGAPGAEAENQIKFWRAFIADQNEAGGVAGRQLVPVFALFDPLSASDARRACIELTEEREVFAILNTGGFFGDPVLCVTEEHGVPLISGQGEDQEWYARSRGLLFTPEMSATRMARNHAIMAHRQDRLRGKTLGVLTSQHPQHELPTKGGLLPQLRALGYKVAHITTLSADSATASSQMPVEVAEMRRKGVEHILVTSHAVYAALWFNEADAQQYRPEHSLSDLGSASNNFTVQAAPRDLDAIAYTVMRQGEERTGRPQQAEGADCQARYQARTGERIEQGTGGYDQLTASCGTVALFSKGTASVGPGLTRPGWSQAMQRVGEFVFADIGGAISLAPGKFDGADFLRTKVYEPDCRCWIPNDEFVRGE